MSTKTLRGDQLLDLLKPWLPQAAIEINDEQYVQPSAAWLSRYIQGWLPRRPKAVTEAFDCEDFANRFQSFAAEAAALGGFTAGAAVGTAMIRSAKPFLGIAEYGKPHTLNIAVIEDRLVVIEPQTGQWTQFPADGVRLLRVRI